MKFPIRVIIKDRKTDEVMKTFEFDTKREYKAFLTYWAMQCDWENYYFDVEEGVSNDTS